jgi:hypothetical protein
MLSFYYVLRTVLERGFEPAGFSVLRSTDAAAALYVAPPFDTGGSKFLICTRIAPYSRDCDLPYIPGSDLSLS